MIVLKLADGNIIPFCLTVHNGKMEAHTMAINQAYNL